MTTNLTSGRPAGRNREAGDSRPGASPAVSPDVGRHFRQDRRPPSALVPDPLNPRRHPPKQITALRESIRRFGFTTPVLIQPDGTIIYGHGRTEAAIAEGLETIPVWIAEGMSPQQARELMLVDNRVAELATWDPKQLGDTLKLLSDAGSDLKAFDLELIPADPERAKAAPKIEDAAMDVVFWIAVEGPFSRQPEVIQAIKALAEIPDVQVHSNVKVAAS